MSDDKTPPPATNGAAENDAGVKTTAPVEDVPKLMSKIQVLEQELVDAKLKIKNLEDEISSHESDKRALTSIAAKTSELESQFSSLEHELISYASEFEATQRENAEKMSLIEFERDLLLEAKERQVLDDYSELKDQIIEMNHEISELKARDCVRADQISEMNHEVSELRARVRQGADQMSELQARFRKQLVIISEIQPRLEALERKKADEISQLKARQCELEDKLSEQEAIGRQKSDKISELEARLKSHKISELEARLEAAEREKRIKLIH